MDAIEFVSRYPTYIAQLGKVVKPERQPIIRRMKKLDPHDVCIYSDHVEIAACIN